MRRFLFALMNIVFSLSLSAKEKVDILSEPTWLYPVKIDATKKTDLKDVSNGYYLELLDRQQNVITSTYYTHFIRHIVNESGVQNASEVSVMFSPLYESVSFHKVNVVRDGQVISQLNLKDIQVVQGETDTRNFQYNGKKRAFIILKDVRKNDRIEVSYSIVGENPIYNNRFSTSVQFYNYSPITNYFETIITPPDKKLNFTYYHDAPRPQEETTATSHVYHWSNPKLTEYEYHAGAPSWYTQYPYITVSEFQSWNEVVNWAYTVFNGYKYELPAALLQKMKTWKEESHGDNEVFATLALRYVQDEIRYLGLEIGIHTYKPHEPKDVFRQAYGDCKDKALLLAMILQHENIPAYVALLNTTKRSQMYKAAPSPDEFDHAIVAIQRDDRFLYVDPTRSLQKGELWDNYIPSYGYALLIRENETNLRQIPPAELNSVYIVETLTVKFEDTSRLSVYSLYKGGKAEKVRSEFAEISEKDMKDSYEEYYEPIFEHIKMDGDISYNDNGDQNSVLIEEEYFVPKIWKKEEKKQVFSVYAKAVHQEMSEEPSEKDNYPIALNFPTSIQYTMNIELPEQWSFPSDELHIKNDYYQFDFKSELNVDKVKLTYYYKTFSDHIPIEELEQYRKDYAKMVEVIQYQLTYGETASATDYSKDTQVSWRAAIITFVGFGLMAFLLTWLNKRNVDVEYDRNSGWKIGGWMIVLGVSLCANLGVTFYNLFYQDHFKNAKWEAFEEMGNVMLAVGTIELTFDVIKFAACIAVVIWFFKRRDIFPSMFISFVGMLLTMQTSLFIIYNAFDVTVDGNPVKDLIRTFVYAGIWGTYVWKSYRTKATFLKAS